MTKHLALIEASFWRIMSENAVAADARLYAWEQAVFYQEMAEKL